MKMIDIDNGFIECLAIYENIRFEINVHQEALDELVRAARLQLAGSAYAARPIPFESIAMCMLLAQHRVIADLQHRVKQLETAHGEDTDNHRVAV